MSTENAAWLFDTSTRATSCASSTATASPWTPFGNGFGDWNLNWQHWRRGSALMAGSPDAPNPAQRARLRPEAAEAAPLGPV